eukprot:366351-Chlamydomonas_euryale.AAC.13
MHADLPLLHRASAWRGNDWREAIPDLSGEQSVSRQQDVTGCTLLHKAAGSQAPLEVVRLLLHAFKDAAAVRDGKGNTPLHLAVANQASLEVVELLQGACEDSISVRDKKGNTALHLAASNKAPSEVVEFLLRKKQPSAAREGSKYTPLQLAVKHDASFEVVQMLLGKCNGGLSQSDYVKLLLMAVQNRADLNKVQLFLGPSSERISDNEYAKVLRLAAIRRAPLDVVQLLLSKCPGALTMQDTCGNIALQLAVIHNAPLEVLRLLLEETSKVAMMEDGAFAKLLHLAIEKKANQEVVEELLKECKEAAKIKDAEGNTPLHLAITNEASQGAVELLLGLWPQAAQEMDNDKNLPLHLACEAQSAPEVIDALLKAHSVAAVTPSGKGVEPSTLLSSHDVFVSTLPGRIAAFTSEPAADSPQGHVWHAIVGIPQAAPDVRKAVAGCEGLARGCKVKGRSAYEAAHAKCRDAMNEVLRRLGRYEFQRQAHRSATSIVELAVDKKFQDGPVADGQSHDSQAVALKWMKGFSELKREVQTRLDLGLDNDFVVGMLRVHVNERSQLSENNQKWLSMLMDRDGKHVDVVTSPFRSCVPEEYR